LQPFVPVVWNDSLLASFIPAACLSPYLGRQNALSESVWETTAQESSKMEFHSSLLNPEPLHLSAEIYRGLAYRRGVLTFQARPSIQLRQAEL
jgi:hypothetical protein